MVRRHAVSVRAGTLFVVLLAAACVPLPGGRSLARRTIAAKEGDATLVADDGSRCTVPADAFARVGVGEEYACVWKETDVGAPRGTPRTGPREPRRPGPP